MDLKFGSVILPLKIKKKTLDTLPFEKKTKKKKKTKKQKKKKTKKKKQKKTDFVYFYQGFIYKMSSNFASRLELGREWILNFIICQTLKFSERLNKLPATHFSQRSLWSWQIPPSWRLQKLLFFYPKFYA